MKKNQYLQDEPIDLFLKWAICGVSLFLALATFVSAPTSSTLPLSLILLAQGIIICPRILLPISVKIGFSIFTYLMLFY